MYDEILFDVSENDVQDTSEDSEVTCCIWWVTDLERILNDLCE